jgi:hypothetical protein
MKGSVIILLFIARFTCAQPDVWTNSEIEKYAKQIDKLRTENILLKVSYPNMSFCGGGVDGYYLRGKLVLIEATYSAELGFSSRKMYLKNDTFLKIILHKHIAEWGKYDKNYPPDKYEWDTSKMTYTDTIYLITLGLLPDFRKKFDGKIRKESFRPSLANELLLCGQRMKAELQWTVSMVDSLRYVKEMPYICETGICGDPIFWDAVRMRDNAVELLIDKLDDTTTTEANVILFVGTYTTADIAYTVINELIHNIPTFELLGVPFDKDGCGYCSYWQHLNKDYRNRQKFKQAVFAWYHKNKDKLVWVANEEFASCDCSGKHPNRGHFELK